MRAEHKRPLASFTLLEVLLAVAVFSVVLLSIHGVFFAALGLRNRTVKELDASVSLQQTVALLRRDLANLVAPGGTIFGELQSVPSSTGAEGQLDLSAAQSMTSASAPGAAGPTFYTAVGQLGYDQPWAEVARVSYYLAESTNTAAIGKDLYRVISRNRLPTLEEQSSEQWLMSGIEGIYFSFYDGRQWLDSWDSAAEDPKLPQGIKVQIELAAADHQIEQELIELVVPVLVHARTNATAQATAGGQP